MPRELNKNDFYRIKRAYDDALELYEHGYYKETLLELKSAFSLLERDGIQTRFLAKAKILQAKANLKLNRKQKAVLGFQAALATLEKIGDHGVLHQEALDLLRQAESVQES